MPERHVPANRLIEELNDTLLAVNFTANAH